MKKIIVCMICICIALAGCGKEKSVVKEAIQVCLTINDENFDREYNGLLDAMQNLGVKEGTIVTLNQADKFEKDDMVINMIPVNMYLKA